MSYDITLRIKTGQDDYAYCYEDNYTYNVGDMFYKALGFPFSHLSGMKAESAIQFLKTAYFEMIDPSKKLEYEAMNPKNGWGDHEGATAVIKGLLEACQKHYLCEIYIF